MSRRNVLLPATIATNQSLSTSFNSQVTMIPYGDNVSYQINVNTTNSVGTFQVEGSNDYSPNTPDYPTLNAGNWTPLNMSGVPTVNAASNTFLLNLNQVPYKALRIAYQSSTAGTGTCSILIGYKGLA